MLHKSLQTVVQADVEALIRDGVRELRTLDYKLQLPGDRDEDKRELLADICSFANAAGGDLVFGVQAKDGVPESAVGLREFVEDRERLRLESVIRDNIAPRLLGVQLQVVPGFEAGPVLIIRVPQSWSGPHMVTFRGTSRFFVRSSAGKYQMDIDEIRTAFQASGDLAEKLWRWRLGRIAKVVAGETPVDVRDTAKMVLHVVPVVSLRNQNLLSADELKRKQVAFAAAFGSGGWYGRINVDGLVTYPGARDGERPVAYCQVFRSGRIEAVTADLTTDESGVRFIASIWYEKLAVGMVAGYVGALQELGVSAPVSVSLTMLGVKGVRMAAGRGLGAAAIDRDQLLLPDVLFDHFSVNVAEGLRPIFDAVWNAAGYPRSLNYDENGNWAPPA